MIVRNEARILDRCLDSVRPWISYWVISDTGSTDGTPELIREALKDVPGELHQDDWVDFGRNRTTSLKRARGKADYHLLLDADMTLNVAASSNDFRAVLSADSYLVRFEGLCDYAVQRILSDRHEWSYIGATHEYVTSPTATAIHLIEGVTVTHHEDGGSRADKFERDIRLLLAAHQEEPGNPRTTYYLAQSYRDLGVFDKAVEFYEKRVLLGGWDEERWHALYQAGKLHARSNPDWRVALHTLLQAWNLRPSRLEPLYHLARFYRVNKQFALAWHFARLINEVPYPANDVLFVEKDVYRYWLPMEYGVACWHLGQKEAAKKTFDEILSIAELPDEVRELIHSVDG